MIQSGGLSQLPEPELSFQDCEKFLLLQDPPPDPSADQMFLEGMTQIAEV